MKITLNNDNVYNETIIELSKLIRGTRWENNVYLVGGAVRDLIMGKRIKDIDLCVTLLDGGIKFAEWVCLETGNYKEESNPCIFKKYGTAKFNLRNMTSISKVDIECVHTRKEQYHDSESRNPETSYGTIDEDCNRRDLTINALYLNISTFEVIDPCGKGIEDINNHILRTPTDPDIVYKDDPLRMLRAIRFSSKFNWGIEKDTWLGIVKNAYRINIISQERITEEINKILLTDVPSYGIRKLYHCGLLKLVLPTIYNLIGVEQNKYHFGDVFDHTMSTIDKTKSILVNRLAALFHDCGKPYCRTFINGVAHFYDHEKESAIIANVILRRMKYSKPEINKVDIAIKNHMRFKQSGNHCPSNKAIRKFISDVGDENIGITLDVIDADNKSHAKEYCLNDQVAFIINKINELKQKENVSSEAKLPINGKDIIERFNLKSSPKIGTFLEVIKDRFLENPNITKEECLDIVEKLLTV